MPDAGYWKTQNARASSSVQYRASSIPRVSEAHGSSLSHLHSRTERSADAPARRLKCPYCGAVFQLAVPQPAPAGIYAAGQVQEPFQGELQEPTGPVELEFRRPIVRRKRSSNHGMMVALIVLFVALVGGLIGAGVWYSQAKQEGTVAAAPSDPVRQKAHELVAHEMKLPAGVQFAQAEERVEKLNENRWRISSHMDVPSRVGGVYLRQKWVAQVTQLADGSWKLEQLKVDGENILARAEEPELPSRFADPAKGQFSEIETGVSRGASGQDRSTRWAVERMTAEIRESARLRPTLVVWLVDRSMSVRPQQQEFLRNAETVLRELKSAKGGEEPPLSMAVVSFGSDVKFALEKPSSDPMEVRKALEAVEEDTSGRETTFAAIGQADQKFGSFRAEKSGYVLFVIVSDEAGDDDGELDGPSRW